MASECPKVDRLPIPPAQGGSIVFTQNLFEEILHSDPGTPICLLVVNGRRGRRED
jgi:hypothetical protein